ncbi:hypothetical protein ACFL7M_12815 [Thermodesulfobacteriota bacterium]
MNRYTAIRNTGLLILSLLFFISSPTFAAGKRVAVFPFLIYGDPSKAYLSRGLKSMFISRLSGGDLEVMGDESYGPLLNEKEKGGIASGERAKELAGRLKANYAIFGSVTAVGDGYSLDLSILDLGKKESEPTTISEAVNEDQLILKLADMAYQFRSIIEGVPLSSVRRAGLPSTPEPEKAGRLFIGDERSGSGFQPTGRLPLRMQALAFDMGDLNGNGNAEWVVLGRKKLLVYSREDGGTPVLRGSLEPSIGESFLKVSVGDADRNGRSEIYLVTLYGSTVRTVVWEWSAGKFKRLFHQRGNVQVLRAPSGDRPVILFQDSGIEEPFLGPISVADYGKKDKLIPSQNLAGLKNAQFYTLALHDFNGDGHADFFGLDKDSRLNVWDRDGDSLWKGTEKWGGTNHTIGVGEDPQFMHNPEYTLPLNSRLVIMDIDRDGKKEVVTVKNKAITELVENLASYTKGNLVAYRIESGRLVRAWTSREFSYCISDMQTDGNSLYLAAHKIKFTNISSGTGVVMWFD